MADLVATARTTLGSEDVIVRAVQFFTNEKWRPQTQSARIATFRGRPPIPWGSIIIALVFIWTIIVPIIMYIVIISKVIRFQNLTVTTNPLKKGAEVTVTYPKHAKKLVGRFMKLLPAATGAA